MNVFVTGASGTLGRPVVERLLDKGYQVFALARSDSNVALLERMGAVARRANLFDRASLVAGMSGCQAVLHLATRIPPARDAFKRAAWSENDRIRSEGTKTIIDVALKLEAETVVYPSICFLYADGGDQWIDETGVVHAPPFLYSAVVAESEIERFTNAGGRGIVLRMGSFSGPDAPNIDEALDMARRGIAPLIGSPEAYFSRIDVADAAEAVVAALEKAPAGIYNVVEDAPRTRREILEEMAGRAGRKRLRSVPLWIIRMISGRNGLVLARSQRVSNKLFKEATGWEPGH